MTHLTSRLGRAAQPAAHGHRAPARAAQAGVVGAAWRSACDLAAAAAAALVPEVAHVVQHPRGQLDGDLGDLGVGDRRRACGARGPARRAPSRSSRSPITSNPASRMYATAGSPRSRHSSTRSGGGPVPLAPARHQPLVGEEGADVVAAVDGAAEVAEVLVDPAQRLGLDDAHRGRSGSSGSGRRSRGRRRPAGEPVPDRLARRVRRGSGSTCTRSGGTAGAQRRSTRRRSRVRQFQIVVRSLGSRRSR